MKEFSTIKNEKTGSVFHVIGAAANDLIGSIRIYSEAAATKSKSVFLFRFRVERDADAPPSIVDFKTLLKQTLPGAQWDSGSKAHASMSGTIQIDRPLWNLEGVLEALAANDVFGQIFDGITSMLEPMSFYCDREEFAEFMSVQVVNIITNGAADSTSEVPTVVVSLLDKKMKLQAGQQVEDAPQQQAYGIDSDAADDNPDFAPTHNNEGDGIGTNGSTPAETEGDDHASLVGL